MSDNVTDTPHVYSDSSSFFDQLTIDILSAQNSIEIQCMSFEADQIGIKLIELLVSKPTLKRTLLIDSYSKYVVNDVFLNAPAGWLNKNNARSERKNLNRLLERARESGIHIEFTNPIGFMMSKYPFRNHKKMVLIDDAISYLGGMNFTEHNFQWKDIMIRHVDEHISSALKESFQADLNGTESEPITKINDDYILYSLNGLKTRSAYHSLLDKVRSCNKIVAVSPYISYPMLDAISEVPDNTVLLPVDNNKPLIHLLHRMKRYSDVNFRYLRGGMMHMKLLILDDSTAIYGSSNFDMISYFFEKEVILVNDDKNLISHLNKFVEDLIHTYN